MVVSDFFHQQSWYPISCEGLHHDGLPWCVAWWAGYCSKFAYLGLQELVIIRGHIIFKLTLVPSPGLVKHGKALPKKSTEYFPTSSWEQVPSSSPSGIPSISWLTPRYLPHQALHLPATCSLIVECYDAMGSMPWLHCIQPHSGATGTHWHTGANAMPMSIALIEGRQKKTRNT